MNEEEVRRGGGGRQSPRAFRQDAWSSLQPPRELQVKSWGPSAPKNLPPAKISDESSITNSNTYSMPLPAFEAIVERPTRWLPAQRTVPQLGDHLVSVNERTTRWLPAQPTIPRRRREPFAVPGMSTQRVTPPPVSAHHRDIRIVEEDSMRWVPQRIIPHLREPRARVGRSLQPRDPRAVQRNTGSRPPPPPRPPPPKLPPSRLRASAEYLPKLHGEEKETKVPPLPPVGTAATSITDLGASSLGEKDITIWPSPSLHRPQPLAPSSPQLEGVSSHAHELLSPQETHEDDLPTHATKDTQTTTPINPGTCSHQDDSEYDRLLPAGSWTHFQLPLPPASNLLEPNGSSETKGMDARIEMQEMIMKKRKEEVERAVCRLEDHVRMAGDIREHLCHMRGTSGYLYHLVMMMERIRNFIGSCEVSVEILERKCAWPSNLVEDLESMLSLMDGLAAKVSEMEKLCHENIQVAQSSKNAFLMPLNTALAYRQMQQLEEYGKESFQNRDVSGGKSKVLMMMKAHSQHTQNSEETVSTSCRSHLTL